MRERKGTASRSDLKTLLLTEVSPAWGPLRRNGMLHYSTRKEETMDRVESGKTKRSQPQTRGKRGGGGELSTDTALFWERWLAGEIPPSGVKSGAHDLSR